MAEAEETKQPASETVDNLSDKALRLWTTVVVFAVLAVFGLPLWWSTTTVYRAPLPMERINQLSSVKISVRVHLELLCDDYTLTKKSQLKADLDDILNKGSRTGPVIEYTTSAAPQPDWFASAVNAGQNLSDALESGGSSAAASASALDKIQYGIVLQHYVDGSVGSPTLRIGSHQFALVLYDKAGDLKDVTKSIGKLVENILLQYSLAQNAYKTAAGETVSQKKKEAANNNLMSVPSAAGYRLAFTLINSDPDNVRVDWDMRQASRRYLQPFLAHFSAVANFTVDSQILHYISSDIEPSRHAIGAYQLRQDQLAHMINPLESALGSQTSNFTTLHFIVYIPNKKQMPLQILNQDGSVSSSNAFLVHRWGSVLIHNVDDTTDGSGESPGQTPRSSHQLSDSQLSAIMATFTHHLKQLLGVSQLSDRQTSRLSVTASSSLPVTQWELNNLLLCRIMEQVARSRATLQALVKLLDDVTNMVIADHIQYEVLKAVDLIDGCLSQLSQGSLHSAYSLSRNALVASEKAFFDPSMLSLLYFPEESKYAIYVPLFIPMAVPVMASVVQSVKLFKQLRQAKSQAKLKSE